MLNEMTIEEMGSVHGEGFGGAAIGAAFGAVGGAVIGAIGAGIDVATGHKSKAWGTFKNSVTGGAVAGASIGFGTNPF